MFDFVREVSFIEFNCQLIVLLFDVPQELFALFTQRIVFYCINQ
jgi:hypothetical protein